jgi:hypothetical protein
MPAGMTPDPNMAMANPAMMKASLLNPVGGGSDSDKTDGSRPNRISGVKDERAQAGAPKASKHQRGHDKSPIEQALESFHKVKEKAADPLGDLSPDSGFNG